MTAGSTGLGRVGVDVGDGPVAGGAGEGFFEAAAVAAEVVGEQGFVDGQVGAGVETVGEFGAVVVEVVFDLVAAAFCGEGVQDVVAVLSVATEAEVEFSGGAVGGVGDAAGQS